MGAVLGAMLADSGGGNGDSGGGGDGLFSAWLTPQTVIVLAIVLLVLVLLGALATWRVLRRVRQSPQWQHRVAAARIRRLPAGPQREIAELRQRLQRELAATDDAVHGSADGRVFTANAHSMFADLSSAASGLDADLRRIAAYPSTAQQEIGLSIVRAQVEQLIAACTSTRQTILQTAAEDRSRELSRLSRDVQNQAAALSNYRTALNELEITDSPPTAADDQPTTTPGQEPDTGDTPRPSG